MPDLIQQYLVNHGPSRSSLIVEDLVKSGLTAEAARQRVSRAKMPVLRFPIPMLPKREAFLYLKEQRNSDWFWDNFMRDMRATGSVFSAAIDGVIARGGLVRREDFAVISSAPRLPIKGQISVSAVTERLLKAGFMRNLDHNDAACYILSDHLTYANPEELRARESIELALMNGIREWAKHIGLASFNTIKIRSEPGLEPIGPFMFDMAGPSYLLPLKGPNKPGFLVADVFAEGRLGVNEIQYFIRKANLLKSILKDIGVLSIIVGNEFSGDAINAGHAAGIVMATPKNLFGKRVGDAIISLLEVLKSAANYAASHPERIMQLMESLFEIEGRNGNLRGILFELVVGYLARRDAVSIDMNRTVKSKKYNKIAEIDVLKITNQSSSVTAIECKGKIPGGVLEISEVEKWLKKIPIIRSFFNNSSFYESEHRFEIWTSGIIHPDALSLLKNEKKKQSRVTIDWKDGQAVLKLARKGKEKGIADALEEHFLQHPLSKTP